MSKVTTHPLQVLAGALLSSQQIKRLQAIEEYDLWFVRERIARDGSIAEHRIEPAVTEFKRYMALIALGYEDLGMHSKDVDEVWHSFILFTREYSEFCKSGCGQMVHHRPNTSRRPQLPESSVPAFKESYEKFFGPLPQIWSNNFKLAAGDCDVTMDPPSVLQGECDTAGGEADIYQPEVGC
jgi:hypothetical protein